jgi:hypothetical protein
MHIGLFNGTLILSTYFRKVVSYQIRRNQSSMSGVVTYGHTDMTKLIAAYRNFADASLRWITCEDN